MLSVVIPSNRSFEQFKELLISLNKQSFLPDEIVLVYDRNITPEEHESLISSIAIFSKIGSITHVISHISDSGFIPGSGASYVRNYGINYIQSPLVICIDDDNILEYDFLESMMDTYSDFVGIRKYGVLMPIEEYRTTGQIRFAGYQSFNPLIVRPTKSIPEDTPYQISFGPSNCFMGNTALFRKYPFNEDLPFVYEDFLFFKTITNQGYPIYLDPNIKIQHMMRSKNKLQDLYISSPELAFQKGKNRTILIKKTGTTKDKILYFGFGIRGQTAYLVGNIILLAPRQQKLPLIISLLRGTIKGLQY